MNPLVRIRAKPLDTMDKLGAVLVRFGDSSATAAVTSIL